MSFGRKDSISPACGRILVLIGSGTKEVPRNICEQKTRSFHAPIPASHPAQVDLGPVTPGPSTGEPPGDARRSFHGLHAPSKHARSRPQAGCQGSWASRAPSPVKPVVSDPYTLPKQRLLPSAPYRGTLCFRLSGKPAPREVLSTSPDPLSLEGESHNAPCLSEERLADISPRPPPVLHKQSQKPLEPVWVDTSQSFQNVWLEIGKVELRCDTEES